VRIVRIGFTAVKGGRHVRYDHVELGLTGPVGDRVFCLVDLSRSRVLRTVENPLLLRTVSRWREGVLSVESPATTVEGVPVGTGSMHDVDYWGRVARVELLDGPWAAAYSRLLGYEVGLARPVTAAEVVYGASVSIVTTGAMQWLNERVGRQLEPERFRPTFVIDTGPAVARIEEAWLGRELQVGRARLRVRRAVSRCAVIDLDPVTGRPNASALKALAESAGGCSSVDFGVDAVVTSPGRVLVGDSVAC